MHWDKSLQFHLSATLQVLIATTISALLLVQPLLSAQLPPATKTQHKFIVHSSFRPLAEHGRVGVDKCKMCIDFAGQALNELLNIILRNYTFNSYVVADRNYTFNS